MVEGITQTLICMLDIWNITRQPGELATCGFRCVLSPDTPTPHTTANSSIATVHVARYKHLQLIRLLINVGISDTPESERLKGMGHCIPVRGTFYPWCRSFSAYVTVYLSSGDRLRSLMDLNTGPFFSQLVPYRIYYLHLSAPIIDRWERWLTASSHGNFFEQFYHYI